MRLARSLIRFVELDPGQDIWTDVGRRQEAQFDYEGRAIFDKNPIDGKAVRYSLSALWDDGRPILFGIGLNPSKARATTGDSTVNRVLELAAREGYGGLFWTNLGGQMETNSRLFVSGGRQAGSRNSEQLQRVLGRLHPREPARDVLIAWGWQGPTVATWLQRTAIDARVQLHSVGPLIKGKPPHPQRYEGDLELLPLSRE
jgi:hypothetical protein